MDKHTVLLALAMVCVFLAFIQRPALPVSIGWFGVFLLILDQLVK